MAAHSAGKLTTNAGTPVQFTANFNNPSLRVAAHSILAQALPGNVGKVYIGLANLNRVSQVGVIAYLAIPTVNIIPSFSATVAYSAASFNLADFWFDVDQPGDGILVSYVLA